MVQRRGVHGRLLSDPALHQVDFDRVRTFAEGADVLVDVLALAEKVLSRRGEEIDPAPSALLVRPPMATAGCRS